MQLVTSSASFGAGTSKQRAGTSKHERASRSRRPSSRLSRPWPSPAPPLQPPMFPDQRRTRQLAGRSLPPPFCCCGRVAPQLAATPVQRYVRTSSQCSGLPCLLRLHERVLHCCTLHCCAVLIASLPQPSQSPCGVCSVPCARCCVTDSAAASLFVYYLPPLIGSAGAAQKDDKRVRHFGGVFTLPYRMQCRSAVWLRARSMSD